MGVGTYLSSRILIAHPAKYLFLSVCGDTTEISKAAKALEVLQLVDIRNLTQISIVERKGGWGGT